MTRSRPRRVAARLALTASLALAVAASHAPHVARAQAQGQPAPSAGDLETARTLLRDGRDKRAAGDVRGALGSLTAAHALAQTPITALELAKTHAMLGELVEARELALSVARMPVQPDETAYSAAARAEASKLAEAVRPRIPALVVRLTGAPTTDAVTVTIDGAPLTAAARGQPRKVNPGKHTIVATERGRPEARATIELAEADTKEVALEIPAPTPEPVTAPQPPVTPQVAGDVPLAPARKRNVLVPIGLVTAGLGFAIGAITGARALSDAHDLEKVCPNKRCNESETNTLDTAKTMGTISTVSFGIALAGAGLAVIGYLGSKPSGRSAGVHVEPVLGLGSVGVRGAF